MVAYKPETNSLMPFVDDTIARWTTCTAMVDYDSVVGGDKFDNLWLLQCPEKVSLEMDEPGDRHLTHARQYLHGAPDRLYLVAHFFSQDIPTSIHKTNLCGRWAGCHRLDRSAKQCWCTHPRRYS